MDSKALFAALFVLLAGNYVWLWDTQRTLMDWQLEFDERVDDVESADENHEQEITLLCEWIRVLHAEPAYKCPRLRRANAESLREDEGQLYQAGNVFQSREDQGG